MPYCLAKDPSSLQAVPGLPLGAQPVCEPNSSHPMHPSCLNVYVRREQTAAREQNISESAHDQPETFECIYPLVWHLEHCSRKVFMLPLRFVPDPDRAD